MKNEVKELLDSHYRELDPSGFIEKDPISVPHRYSKKEDIEIMAFLTASIAWGQRKSILKSAAALEEGMNGEPYRFIKEAGEKEFRSFRGFQHRTFNEQDLGYFLQALQYIYKERGGLLGVFREGVHRHEKALWNGILHFRSVFFTLPHPQRSEKHVADPRKGSSAKRLHMFLRWMVREDGIDFGLWKELGAERLSCPLDQHSGNTARRLGLLERKQNDGKAVEELDRALRSFDPEDPVKYDIALHSLGLEEGAIKE